MSTKPQKQARVTAIIPLEPTLSEPANRPFLKRLGGKGLAVEILLVQGWHPSRQRNLAARKAKGDWLLFLDADAVPEEGLIPGLLEACRRFGAQGAGGPNLPPHGEPAPQSWFGWVLASRFGSGPSAARYAARGSARLCGEKELILCNLLLSRKAFLGAGGFREDLYPNEENELINRLRAGGAKFAYAPEARVRRPRREDLRAFLLQAFRYGRGRMRQSLANFFPGDLLNLAPLGALAWLLSLPFFSGAYPRLLLPACAYAVADAMASFRVLARSREGGAALAALALFPLRHLAYALGLLAGLFQHGEARRDAGPITLRRLKP